MEWIGFDRGLIEALAQNVSGNTEKKKTLKTCNDSRRLGRDLKRALTEYMSATFPLGQYLPYNKLINIL